MHDIRTYSRKKNTNLYNVRENQSDFNGNTRVCLYVYEDYNAHMYYVCMYIQVCRYNNYVILKPLPIIIIRITKTKTVKYIL